MIAMEQTVRQIIERWQRAYSALYSSTVIDAESHGLQEDHLRLLFSSNAPILTTSAVADQHHLADASPGVADNCSSIGRLAGNNLPNDPALTFFPCTPNPENDSSPIHSTARAA